MQDKRLDIAGTDIYRLFCGTSTGGTYNNVKQDDPRMAAVGDSNKFAEAKPTMEQLEILKLRASLNFHKAKEAALEEENSQLKQTVSTLGQFIIENLGMGGFDEIRREMQNAMSKDGRGQPTGTRNQDGPNSLAIEDVAPGNRLTFK